MDNHLSTYHVSQNSYEKKKGKKRKAIGQINVQFPNEISQAHYHRRVVSNHDERSYFQAHLHYPKDVSTEADGG